MNLFSNKLSASEINRELQKLQVRLSSSCCSSEPVPALNIYRDFHKGIHGFSEAAVWSDFALRGAYRLYQLTNDTSVLRKNYLLMSRWVQFLRERAEISPYSGSGWQHSFDSEMDTYFWNTDPYFCHNLIQKILSHPDFHRELPPELTEFLNFHGCEGTLYYAFCVRRLTDIAVILKIEEDVWFLHIQVRQIIISDFQFTSCAVPLQIFPAPEPYILYIWLFSPSVLLPEACF